MWWLMSGVKAILSKVGPTAASIALTVKARTPPRAPITTRSPAAMVSRKVANGKVVLRATGRNIARQRPAIS